MDVLRKTYCKVLKIIYSNKKNELLILFDNLDKPQDKRLCVFGTFLNVYLNYRLCNY